MGSIAYVVLLSLAGATSFALAVVGWQYRGDPDGARFEFRGSVASGSAAERA